MNIVKVLTRGMRRGRAHKEDAYARKVLSLLLTSVHDSGASSCTILLHDTSLLYTFTACDKERKGTIDPRMKDSLQAVLQSLCTSRDGGALFPKEKNIRACSCTQIAEGFLLQWSRKEKEQEESAYNTKSYDVSCIDVEEEGPVDVLFIEDDPFFADLTVKLLLHEKRTVCYVSSAIEALSLLERGAICPRAILSDIHMADMNGIALVTLLRGKEKYRNIPLLALTSTTDVETKVRVLSLGADIWIEKGEDPRVLLAYLSRVLSRSAAPV